MFFDDKLDEKIKKVKADYWDVWSNIFTNTFFKQIYNWCEANGLKFVVHLNHEDMIEQLISSEGQFFSHMKYVHIPAIDVIWRQIWYDKKAIFPKYASSVSHIKGIPYAFSESFAVYGKGISVAQIKWVIDYQFIMDINVYLTSVFSYLKEHPQNIYFSELVHYANLISYLLSESKPTSHVLLYFPTSDLWMGDDSAVKKTLEIANILLENNIDFDFFDHSLLEYFKIDKNKIISDHNKEYDLIILPPVKYIPQQLYSFLRVFSSYKGKILFYENPPQYVYYKTFTSTTQLFETNIGITINSIDQVNEYLKKDVEIYGNTSVKVLYKKLGEDNLIFVFNNKSEEFVGNIILDFQKKYLYVLDNSQNKFALIENAYIKDDKLQLNLYLYPHQTLLFVASDKYEDGIKTIKLPETKPHTLLELNEGWELNFGDTKIFVELLKDWQSFGYSDFSGSVVYKKDFVFSNKEVSNKRLYLYCPNLKYSAKVWLNQKYVGEVFSSPYLWDITDVIKEGENHIVIEVQNTPAASILGTEEKVEKMRKEAEKNFYISFSMKFDLEMVQSGLLPPVSIVVFD